MYTHTHTYIYIIYIYNVKYQKSSTPATCPLIYTNIYRRINNVFLPMQINNNEIKLLEIKYCSTAKITQFFFISQLIGVRFSIVFQLDQFDRNVLTNNELVECQNKPTTSSLYFLAVIDK